MTDRLPPYEPNSYQRDDHALPDVRQPVRLSLSESPYGCSPAAQLAAQEELSRLHRYPDSACADLRSAVAAHHNVAEERILVGNGVDELLVMIAQQRLTTGSVGVCCAQTYFGHAAAILSAGATLRRVAMGPEGELDVEAIAQAMQHAQIALVCNPHNPFGTTLDASGIDRLRAASARHGCLLVLDEAYADFASPAYWGTGLDQIDGAEVIVLRTFSKAYGLAGLRCGYAVARRELLEPVAVARHATPFSVNRVALAAARAALGDCTFLADVVAATLATRDRLGGMLCAAGHHITNSQASFLFVRTTSPADVLADRLLHAHGVHARPCGPLGLPHGLRLGMCRPAQEERVVTALLNVLERESRA